MIQVKFDWRGQFVGSKIQAMSWERVMRCTVYLWQKCVEAVGVSNPRPHKTPSAPGDPPRKRTGFGQRGIQYELNEKEGWGRVGVTENAKYMLYLDRGVLEKGVTKADANSLGGWRIRPRPWLLATYYKFEQQIRSLAGE